MMNTKGNKMEVITVKVMAREDKGGKIFVTVEANDVEIVLAADKVHVYLDPELPCRNSDKGVQVWR